MWLIYTTSFARSPELFASTCADVFARMLNTVPTGVELSEVIEPLPAKPANIKLAYKPDGTIELWGEVRVREVLLVSVFKS
jgi:hypothetical protein